MPIEEFRPDDFSPATLLARRGLKWRLHGDDVIPVWVADMDFPVASCIQRALERIVEQGDYGYALRDGEAPQVSVGIAFAKRMQERFGWHVDPAHTQAAGDVVQTLFATAWAFTEPGEAIALQTPAYPPFREAIEGAGRRIRDNPMKDTGNRFMPDIDGLSEALDEHTRMLFLCNPHNPTGHVFRRDELERIATLAIERDIVVVSDEIHADLIYPGNSHIPFATISEGAARRTVTVTSATKSFNFGGLRCAVMHFGSEELKQRFASRIHPKILGVPGVAGIDATVAAWSEGQPWLDAALQYLQANRDHFVETISREIPEARVYLPEATYLAWVDFSRLGVNESPFQFFLDRARVAVSDGETFDPTSDRFVRINFATSRTVLDEALRRMIEAVRHYKSMIDSAM